MPVKSVSKYTAPEIFDMISQNPAEFYDLVIGGVDIDSSFAEMLEVFAEASEVVDEEDNEIYVDDRLYTRMLEEMMYMMLTDLAFLSNAAMLHYNDLSLKVGNYTEMAGESLGGSMLRMIHQYLYGRGACQVAGGHTVHGEYELGKAHQSIVYMPKHMQAAAVRFLEDGIRYVYPHGQD